MRHVLSRCRLIDKGVRSGATVLPFKTDAEIPACGCVCDGKEFRFVCKGDQLRGF